MESSNGSEMYKVNFGTEENPVWREVQHRMKK
jgi:hypothetical protein